MLFYKHEQCMVHVPANCTKYEQNHHIHLQYDNMHSKFIKTAIITQIWHRDKLYFYVHQYIVPNMNIKSSQSSWRNAQGLTELDCTLSYIPRFHLGGAGNNSIQLFMCEISQKYTTVNRHKYPISAQSQSIF